MVLYVQVLLVVLYVQAQLVVLCVQAQLVVFVLEVVVGLVLRVFGTGESVSEVVNRLLVVFWVYEVMVVQAVRAVATVHLEG